ncbi:hypothetical protein N9B20_01645 [Mariniblastus sp.]|nr:hypothetical protein [Mariniblastus sp.]
MFTSAVDANQYFLRVSEGGKLVLKALEFGAFGEGTECQEIADELMRQSQLPFQNNLVPTPAGKVPIKYLTAWFAVIDPISPDLLDLRESRGIDFKNRSMAFDTSGKEIGIVATAIENEANRIEKLNDGNEKVDELQPAQELESQLDDAEANEANKNEVPSLTRVEQAIIEICDGRKLKNHEIMSELAADGLIIEIRSLKTTVQRLIELGKLHRPDGVDSRKGVTKKT